MVNSIKFLTTSKLLNELKKCSNKAASFSVISHMTRKHYLKEYQLQFYYRNDNQITPASF